VTGGADACTASNTRDTVTRLDAGPVDRDHPDPVGVSVNDRDSHCANTGTMLVRQQP
jgi:hypothetical protein